VRNLIIILIGIKIGRQDRTPNAGLPTRAALIISAGDARRDRSPQGDRVDATCAAGVLCSILVSNID
jgi:hypothetical protein